MEAMMQTRDKIQTGPLDIGLMSSAEFFLPKNRIIREARAAQAAAIHDAFARAVAAIIALARRFCIHAVAVTQNVRHS
jgi:hypothetical protein